MSSIRDKAARIISSALLVTESIDYAHREQFASDIAAECEYTIKGDRVWSNRSQWANANDVTPVQRLHRDICEMIAELRDELTQEIKANIKTEIKTEMYMLVESIVEEKMRAAAPPVEIVTRPVEIIAPSPSINRFTFSLPVAMKKPPATGIPAPTGEELLVNDPLFAKVTATLENPYAPGRSTFVGRGSTNTAKTNDFTYNGRPGVMAYDEPSIDEDRMDEMLLSKHGGDW